MENNNQQSIKDLDRIINAFKESREDQEVEIIEENRQFFIRLLMNKISEMQIRLLISMHINMINLGEYDEIEYNEDEQYSLQQVYDFIEEREMIIDYCETVETNEEYFTKREKEVFDYALSLLKRPEPTEPQNGIKFRKKSFEYNSVKIRIADVEEPYLNTTVVMTRCIAPNNEPFGPSLGRGETLNDLINNTIQFLNAAEKKGIPVMERLTADVNKKPETFGTCPYCEEDIIKSNSVMYKYLCNGCEIDFDQDQWLCIQEVICEDESGPVESGNGMV